MSARRLVATYDSYPDGGLVTKAEEIVARSIVDGCEVHLRPDGSPAVRGKPNAALLAALKENRIEIIRLLGGNPELAPESPAPKKHEFKRICDDCSLCNKIVFEYEDSLAFCNMIRCPYRRRARQEERYDADVW
jgi:hypothetical protein